MIGIVASNQERARTVASDLGLTEIVPIGKSQVSVAARGRILQAVIVDDTAADADLTDVMPCLIASGGHAYRLTRI